MEAKRHSHVSIFRRDLSDSLRTRGAAALHPTYEIFAKRSSCRLWVKKCLIRGSEGSSYWRRSADFEQSARIRVFNLVQAATGSRWRKLGGEVK